ncbi:MAG: hypothetical protein ACI9F9_003399, partial [Candidatus Paceibacteria bacterium]
SGTRLLAAGKQAQGQSDEKQCQSRVAGNMHGEVQQSPVTKVGDMAKSV